MAAASVSPCSDVVVTQLHKHENEMQTVMRVCLVYALHAVQLTAADALIAAPFTKATAETLLKINLSCLSGLLFQGVLGTPP